MKYLHLFLIAFMILAFLPACTTASTPTPTQVLEPTQTPGPELARSTIRPVLLTPSISKTPTTLLPAPAQVSTTPVPTLTPSVTTYAVVLVGKTNTLTIRQDPGTAGKAIGSLPYNAKGIHLTGNETQLQDEKWVEIQSTGGNGWVNAAYLTQSVSSDFFCNDPQVSALLASLKDAIHTKDGPVLQSLVGPVHGLRLNYLRGGAIANYSPAEAGWLFKSTYQMNWGLAPGSGQEVAGSFTQIILPKLIDVLEGEYAPYCNTLKTGGASYPVAWPDDYLNVNFLSLFRAGSTGDELNWRTWVMGVEYSDGKPFIFTLIHYAWEP